MSTLRPVASQAEGGQTEHVKGVSTWEHGPLLASVGICSVHIGGKAHLFCANRARCVCEGAEENWTVRRVEQKWLSVVFNGRSVESSYTLKSSLSRSGTAMLIHGILLPLI